MGQSEILTHARGWVLELDRDGTVKDCNASARKWVQPGQKLAAALSEPRLSTAIEKGLPALVDVKLGDEWQQLDLTPLPDGGFAVVGVDITRLRRSEAMLVDAQGVAHLGTWEWDITQPHASWSTELYKIYNVTPEAYTPSYEAYLTKVHPEDRAHVKRATERVFHEHVPYSHDERIFWPDGSIRYLHTWAHPVLENGKLKRLVGVCQDITDRKLMENQLRKSHKLEAIGRLAAGIAHDFNNLLGVIVARSSLIANSFEQGATRDSADEIIAAARAAARLTQQLVAFSRGQRTGQQVVDLRSVVNDLTDVFGHSFGSNITLERAFADPLPYVVGDRSQFDQVVLNLLVNARDAMPSGGTICIEVASASGQPLPEELDARKDHVVLRVSDQGVGMDEATAVRVFDPYFSTKAQGTGLGLSTVYGVVRQHGGIVTVTSEPGKGSTFQVWLPRAVEPVQAKPAEALSRTHRVLLVDDEADLRRVTRILLQNAGFEVVEAASPEQALIQLDRQGGKVDLLVTDIVMPKMNGLELARRVQQRHGEVKVLFTSGWANETVLQAAHAHRMLQKPFTSEELVSAVASLVSR